MASLYKYISSLRSPKKEIELSPIFKLDVICFAEIFDRLSLDELHKFGQTCKKSQQIAGDYFQCTYKSTEIRCATDGLNAYSYIFCSVQLNGFNRYIQKLSIYGNRNENENDINVFDCMRSNCVDSLRHIQFVDVAMTKKSVNSIRKLLKKVNILEIDTCTMDGKLYQHLLKCCKQLKRLSVRRFGGNIKWLTKHYPALEHLELYQIGFKIDHLKVFFERNQSVHSFAVDANCLWQNEQSIMDANFELDDLIVDINGWEFHIESICKLLNRFFEKRFYRRLYLYAPYIDEESTAEIASVHGLEKLFLTSHIAYGIALPIFANLKQMSFRSCPEFIEIESFAEKLASLERVHFGQATFSDVLLFIGRLVTLNTIKVDHFKNAHDFNHTLDLKTMNEQRKALCDASKIIVYVEETIYLNTKWITMPEMTNELSQIEIQRNDSCEWSHHFEYNRRTF
ncbi:uncharacterized protein LOC116350333 [Contarinia nasturtii]|uniref:uncharacterized protein LOC116350333 n=1 Tax=Contarinia nasturtii TaxID=265458 RepID=UPI0012D3D760|nr:uncharacterized protein LOC116350333 [Contarinia nasturtii]